MGGRTAGGLAGQDLAHVCCPVRAVALVVCWQSQPGTSLFGREFSDRGKSLTGARRCHARRRTAESRPSVAADAAADLGRAGVVSRRLLEQLQRMPGANPRRTVVGSAWA